MKIKLRERTADLKPDLLMTALTDALSGIAEGASKSEIAMGYVDTGKRKAMIIITVDTQYDGLPKD